MKTRIAIFLILFAVLIISCNSYGTKLEYQKTEVYFTDKVDKKDAEKLGDFLVRSEFADGNEKSVQLTLDETNGNYIFRMVTSKEASEKDYYETVFRNFAKQLSDSVFDQKPVDFHVCDNTFTTIKIISFENGTEQ